jgi:hypothetical protein
MSENKDFDAVLKKAEELESMDFGKVEDFNVGEYYTALEKIATQNANFKNEEAESIVSQDAKSMIDESFVKELEEKRNVVESFIRKYDPNKQEVADMELEDVDRVYAISNYLLNAYIQHVNEMKFNVEFSKQEAKWLNKVLLGEIEYNGDEVFNFNELYNNFWKMAQEKMEEDKSAESYVFKVSIKSILILHHLIKGHSVKGRTNDYLYFSSILFKIAKVNKLFNAYNIIIERIKSDRELWGNSIDEVVKSKDPEYQKQMEEMAKQKLGMPEEGFVNPQIHPVTPADLGK